MTSPFIFSSDTPLRETIATREELYARGRELAERGGPATTTSDDQSILLRCAENARELIATYNEIAVFAEQREPLPTGGEWLLDNFHIIEGEVREIHRHLPTRFLRTLPRFAEGRYSEVVRASAIAELFVAIRDSVIDRDSLTLLIGGFQEISTLTIGEVWAIPTMLRAMLIENIRRLAQAGVVAHQDRITAEGIADSVLGASDRPASDRVLLLAKRLEEWENSTGPGAIALLWRLRNDGRKTAVVTQWFEERFKERGIDPEELLREEQRRQAENRLSIANAVNSLRALAVIDWKTWFEETSHVELALREDPAGAYHESDFSTRDRYRREIERLAVRSGRREVDLAEAVVAHARGHAQVGGDEGEPPDGRFAHVGYYLVGRGREEFEQAVGIAAPWGTRMARATKPLHVMAFLVVTFAATAMLCALPTKVLGSVHLPFAVEIAIFLLFAVVASQVAVDLVHWVLMQVVPPRPIAKFDFSEGIPSAWKTAVIVHTLFKDRESIRRAIESLEVRFLGNDDPELRFGILADVHDAASESLASDEGLEQYAVELVEGLNSRHTSAPFFLMFRRRRYNASESIFMGWERKRGKLAEFNRFLLGDDTTSLRLLVGRAADLRGARLVITLDADTVLPRGVAHRLVGTLAHPLNRPRFAPSSRAIEDGYAILQPRVGCSLVSANRSWFSRLFVGDAGIDPYTSLVSNFYFDLFGEGSYIGKGIYDVAAFERSLEGRVPDNRLLSHDLFESFYARCGIVSDIEVLDEFPSRYHAFARREHRWVRGDWQLIPWLARRVPRESGSAPNDLTLLEKWKLIDNLRRSLIDPATLLLVTIGLFFLTEHSGPFMAMVFGVWLLPPLLGLAGAFLSVPQGVSVLYYSRDVGSTLLRNLGQALFLVTVLPHRAWLLTDAIGRTLFRLIFTKRKLIQWESAFDAERRLGPRLGSFIRELRSAAAIALVLGLAIMVLAPTNLPLYLPLGLLWFASPVIAAGLSRPREREHHHLTSPDRRYLLALARDIWAYFDEHLNETHHFLIPDNVQLDPTRVVAPRTSPTNIGLSLVAVVSAHDFGFIQAESALARICGVLRSVSRLERWHGHLLNWYDTTSLAALRPRYVSTVDSGNFIGFLLAVEGYLRGLPQQPLVAPAHVEHLSHLVESALREHRRVAQGATVLRDAIEKLRRDRRVPTLLSEWSRIKEVLSLVSAAASRPTALRLEALARELTPTIELCELYQWVVKLEEVFGVLVSSSTLQGGREISRDIRGLRRSFERKTLTYSLLAKIGQRASLIAWALETQSWTGDHPELQPLQRALVEGCTKIRSYSDELARSVAEARHLIESLLGEIRLEELYDKQRDLFHIGYQLDGGGVDGGRYDLLASEARLTSFVAVALGAVEEKHWFKLGRPLTDTPGGRALLSWSGTMFEYLMPALVLRDYPGTLLAETHRAAVDTQILYGRQHGVPWGISESAYAGVDFHKTYQYRAFGVPALGFKRGLSSDLVISPYSTILAAMVRPHEAIANLRALEEEQARDEYGFVEAVDYTPQRLAEGERFHVVRAFFAHHQGMSLVALNNLLHHGIMHRRFHKHPRVIASELILQERFPLQALAIQPRRKERTVLEELESERTSRSIVESDPHQAPARKWFFSNSRYSLMLDAVGSGWSWYGGDVAITRWREDDLQNDLGLYLYLRDRESGKVWSTTYQPTKVEPREYRVTFEPSKAEYVRRDFGIRAKTEVAVSPDDDVEVRRVTLSNLSARPRRIEITSYAEVVMAGQNADIAHPAFVKMFVETEYVRELELIVCARRQRSRSELPFFVGHMILMPVTFSATQYETSRGAFIGRGRGLADPFALEVARLSGTTGPVLDPIVSLRTLLELEAGQSLQATYLTFVARTRDELLQRAVRYREVGALERIFELAESHANVELRHQQFTLAQAQAFQRLAHALFSNADAVRGGKSNIERTALGQSGLWRLGISGDFPIVLLTVTDQEQIPLVSELLLAHEYLRMRGVLFELVVVNDRTGGYLQEFQQELEFYLRAGNNGAWVDRRGGLFLRVSSGMSDAEFTLIRALARVVIDGSAGDLSAQLAVLDRSIVHRRVARQVTETTPARIEREEPLGDLLFANGFGGFSPDGHEYVMKIRPRARTPRPWSNVISNSRFGFLVTESGAGYTWSENSRENRLTPWSNDPVQDPMGEVLYIRDQADGRVWSATPGPTDVDAVYTVRHGFGYSEFSSTYAGIESRLLLHGHRDRPVKWWRCTLRNSAREKRRLEVILFIDPVMGVTRGSGYRMLIPGYEPALEALTLRNPYNNEFAHRQMAVGSNLPLASFTTSRLEFIGAQHTLAMPEVMSGRIGPVDLSRAIRIGEETALALAVEITLDPQSSREVMFYLVDGASLEEVRSHASYARSTAEAQRERVAVEKSWRERVQPVRVTTPQPSFDLLMNGWLLYQVVSCRVWGRSAFYQGGGAIGFRDQLQDVLAVLPFEPAMTRAQIVLHAGRQFLEGDVQHWWHPPTGRGVRTRISDDLLWLPYVVERYLASTGDGSILDEVAPFLEGPLLEGEHAESYFVPTVSAQSASVYEHCVRAIERSLTAGARGLPLMGSGDWNDGMNEVGVGGRGESVWLAWFLIDVLRRFAPICTARGEGDRAERYLGAAERYREAVERHGWDGEWYMRAFTDEGAAIGSRASVECSIDSIAQSWSVISGAGNEERQKQAIGSALAHLVKESPGLLLLLTPPFDDGPINPGYIKGYLPGIRENGGQYTHAAAWLIMALARQGRGADATRLFRLINPIELTASKEGAENYGCEPYVMCGDVYSNPSLLGWGGWSWYTGSASWMFQVGLHEILGVHCTSAGISIDPCVPPEWRSWEVSISRPHLTIEIAVTNPEGVERGVRRVVVDGEEVRGMIPTAGRLGTMKVAVEMGAG